MAAIKNLIGALHKEFNSLCSAPIRFFVAISRQKFYVPNWDCRPILESAFYRSVVWILYSNPNFEKVPRCPSPEILHALVKPYQKDFCKFSEQSAAPTIILSFH